MFDMLHKAGLYLVEIQNVAHLSVKMLKFIQGNNDVVAVHFCIKTLFRLYVFWGSDYIVFVSA